jgi:DnaJ-class molecular chaperone
MKKLNQQQKRNERANKGENKMSWETCPVCKGQGFYGLTGQICKVCNGHGILDEVTGVSLPKPAVNISTDLKDRVDSNDLGE